MDDNTREIIADLLEVAADAFSNHTCNDFALPNIEDNRKLARALHRWEGLADEDAEPQFSDTGLTIIVADCSLMSYFAHMLTKKADPDA